MNKSIQNGVIPEVWKEAIITPIYKGKGKTKPENHHPVSLTSRIIKLPPGLPLLANLILVLKVTNW